MSSAIIPSIAATALRKPLEDIYTASKDALRRKLRAITTELRLRDIQKAIKSVQKVKTMWRIDKEVPLTTFYYPSKIAIGKQRKPIASVADISTTENFVIQGTVGQGKSIFLRYLCLKELAASQRVPIFLELRRYKPSVPFIQFLVSGVTLYRIPCDDAIFDHLAESGKVVLLLDAFDEVEQEAVSAVLSDLEALVQRYPQLQVVVTSRPDSGIERSPHFRVYNLAPLTADDHAPFLERIVDEQERVDEIISAIKKSKAEIRSLLTTPLLLTLLVIIYNSTQEIPDSLSDFYDALFYTLLTRHDKSKPGFRRKRETGLSDSELRKLFEAFCYAARQQDQLVLKDSNIASLVERASAATAIKANAEAFAHDMSKVACLMQQEGFEYHFIHKSVVEFHAAAFISRTSEENARRFYEGVSSQKWTKWLQEITFLSQIDRHRYLKYFYMASARQAIDYFGIDEEGGAVSAQVAGRVLNCIRVTQETQRNGQRILQYEIGGSQSLVTHELVLGAFESSVTQPLHSQPEGVLASKLPIGLWDVLAMIDQQSTGIASVKAAVDRFLKSVRSAKRELELESKVAEFVAP